MKESRLKDPGTHAIWVALILGFLIGWHFFDEPQKPPYEVWMEDNTIYIVQESGGYVFSCGKIGEDWECNMTLGQNGVNVKREVGNE